MSLSLFLTRSVLSPSMRSPFDNDTTPSWSLYYFILDTKIVLWINFISLFSFKDGTLSLSYTEFPSRAQAGSLAPILSTFLHELRVHYTPIPRITLTCIINYQLIWVTYGALIMINWVHRKVKLGGHIIFHLFAFSKIYFDKSEGGSYASCLIFVSFKELIWVQLTGSNIIMNNKTKIAWREVGVELMCKVEFWGCYY